MSKQHYQEHFSIEPAPVYLCILNSSIEIDDNLQHLWIGIQNVQYIYKCTGIVTMLYNDIDLSITD